MSTDKNKTVVEAIHAPRLNSPSMVDTNIETYFMSLEFWFAASGISSHAQQDTRKYNIVMAQVPPNKLSELRSIIDATPTAEKYTYIKTKLIEYFADSQQRRLQRVLSDMPLVKPSQLYNEMKRVAGDSLGDMVLLDLWATRLPPHAQAAVVASKGNAAEKTTIADAIVDSMGLRKINAVEYNVQKSAMASSSVMETAAVDPIQELKREIAELFKRRKGAARSAACSGSQQNSRRERQP